MPRLRSTAVLALLVIALPALVGCSALQDVVGTDVPEGETDVFTIQVGDCLDDAGTTEVQSVPVVDCASPHDFEAYLAADMPKGEYPGSAAVTEFGDATCGRAFTEFTGVTEAETSLTWTYYSPLEEGWASGDREILCLAGDTNGKVTGSLEGAGAEYPLG